MDKLRDQLNRPLVLAGIAFVVGLLFGLVVLGWWLWPVQWTDASARELRADLREDYLRASIDSYARNPNPELAKQRLTELGDQAGPALEAIKKLNGTQDPAVIGEFDKLLYGQLGVPAATLPAETPAAGAVQPTVEATKAAAPVATPVKAGPRSNLTIILVLLCLLTLVIAAVLVYLFVFRNRQGQGAVAAGATIPRVPGQLRRHLTLMPPLTLRWCNIYRPMRLGMICMTTRSALIRRMVSFWANAGLGSLRQLGLAIRRRLPHSRFGCLTRTIFRL
jgi:hypothetical protein